MNADAPWADLADSDDDDMGWSLRPVSGEEASPVQDPLHNDGTIPVAGPLIPSFSGEDVMGAAKGVTAVGGGAQSDLSTASFGRLESPTPVAIIQDLTSQPSRTQFGFALGSALSSKAALGGADGFLGATASDVAGSHAQWAKLQNRSKDSVPEFAVEPRLEAVHPVNSDERVCYWCLIVFENGTVPSLAAVDTQLLQRLCTSSDSCVVMCVSAVCITQ